MEIQEKDLVDLNHNIDKGTFFRHPFIVFHITENSFWCVQLTSTKYDKNTGEEMLSKFQDRYTKENGLYYPITDKDGTGIDNISWVLLEEVHEIPVGDNIYKVKKRGKITNNKKYREIRKLVKQLYNIPLDCTDITTYIW